MIWCEADCIDDKIHRNECVACEHVMNHTSTEAMLERPSSFDSIDSPDPVPVLFPRSSPNAPTALYWISSAVKGPGGDVMHIFPWGEAGMTPLAERKFHRSVCVRERER